MRPVLAIAALALPLMAQVPAVRQTRPPARSPAAPRTGVPSPKDLRYPPLRPIQIPNIESVTLPNGMRLYLLEDHELPLVSGTALVRTGNLFDPPDKVGLAGLTGTVMRSGGTRVQTGEQLDEQLENMAASVESNIGESTGSVSFNALKENTAEVLAAFRDVLTSPEFRLDKLDLAKSQMRSAISRRNDDAASIAQREFSDILYGRDNPYGWDETYATIDSIKRSDLQAFYKRYFFPANVMLAVRGDFNSAEMKDRITKLFADWTVQQPPVGPFPKVGAAPQGGIYLAVKKEVAQTFFSVGQQAGMLNDKDYPALEIMADILGGGFQSRLMQRIRTKMGNAYDISADWGVNYDHPGLFQISGSTKSMSTVETIKAVREEVERIRTTEVTEQELKTAKDTALNSLVFAYDTKSKTLGRLLSYEYFGYPKDFIQQYQKALAEVTRADVLRVAKEHLDPSKFIITAVGNPADFGTPLESLGGKITPIDLTIAPPKTDSVKTDEASRQKGKELLQKAQQAVGGVDKLLAVKDYTSVAEYQLSQAAGNMKATETDRWIAPTSYRNETVLPTGTFQLYWDGEYGWLGNLRNSIPLAGNELEQAKGDAFRIYFRLLLSDHIEGRTVSSTEDDTIEITDASGQATTIILDPNGLPTSLRYLGRSPKGDSVITQETFADFREVNGIKFPFTVKITQRGEHFATVVITDLKMNTGLKVQDLRRRP